MSAKLEMTGKTVWITGATSGIGRAFARAYGEMGCRLILTARNAETLTALAGELNAPCRILAADLTDEAACRRLLKETAEETVDVFINNAGFGVAGPFLETDLDRELELLRLNDMALHLLFKEVLRRMAARDRGTIVNVASSAGLFPGGPYMAAYYASKAYAVSLTVSVAQELREQGSGVYVCALCPGPVDTNFNRVANVTFALPGITPEECVASCFRAMARRKTVIVPTAAVRLAVVGQRLLPRQTVLRLVGGQQKRKLEG